MKNKLAKLLRAWAERLSPNEISVSWDQKIVQSRVGVQFLNRYDINVKLENGLNDRETEYAIEKVKANMALDLTKDITVRNSNGKLTATFFYYA